MRRKERTKGGVRRGKVQRRRTRNRTKTGLREESTERETYSSYDLISTSVGRVGGDGLLDSEFYTCLDGFHRSTRLSSLTSPGPRVRSRETQYGRRDRGAGVETRRTHNLPTRSVRHRTRGSETGRSDGGKSKRKRGIG